MKPSAQDSAKNALLKSVNLSGFPLQLAVAKDVRASEQDHGWSVTHQEHSWSNTAGASGFADLILQSRDGSINLVVECKRIRQSNGERPLIFLSESADEASKTKAFILNAVENNKIKSFQWEDIYLRPNSAESMFYVVQDAGNQRTAIENGSSELVVAAEALAGERLSLKSDHDTDFSVYILAVVTNAPLWICNYKQENLSSKSGEILDAEFKSVPFVRYRKQLSSYRRPTTEGQEITPQELSRLKENTVFMINSEALPSFLTSFDVPWRIRQNRRVLQ